MTLTNSLIRQTTTTITTNNSISYSFNRTRSGLSNNYRVLGLIVSTETTKERGWNLYETDIRVGYTHHWGTPDGFSEWLKDYKTSLGVTKNKSFVTYTESIDNHSKTKLANAHNIGVLASESYVLTIINKYIELLFNSVDKEVITRQINELQSQLTAIA